MRKVTYEQFVELLKKYDRFELNTLNAMYSEFGKELVSKYFNEYYETIPEENVPAFLSRYSVFFDSNAYENFEVKEFGAVKGTILDLMINDAGSYLLMTYDEEYEYGMNLLEAKENLKIVKNTKDDAALYPNLNLEILLASIKTEEQVNKLSEIRKLAFTLRDDEILKDESQILKKFCKLSMDKRLSVKELQKEFPSLNFVRIKPIDDIDYQLELLEKYIIAKHNFFKRNLRLVISIAKKGGNAPLTFEEKLQEGHMGLIKAINKYDASKKYRFSTYATWWIRQSINRAFADQGNIIRIPVHFNEVLLKYQKYVNKYKIINGVDPTIEEASEALGVSADKIYKFLLASQGVVSLDSPINDDEDSYLGDYIKDENVILPEANALAETLKDDVNDILQTLTCKEEAILRYRFGFNDGREMTLQEIGEQFGVTRERVRQIEAKALRKLKHKARAKGLCDFE